MNLFWKLILKTKLSRYFYKLFFSSIILITVILIILGSVVYVGFINTFRTEVENANVAGLTRIVNNMDLRFKEMDRLAFSIVSDPEFDYFGSIGKIDAAYKMVKELKKYKASNEFLYDIIYYSTYNEKNNNRIITSKGSMDTDLFFKYIYNYQNWGKDQFLNLIKQMDTRKVRPLEPVKLNYQFQTNVITFIYPLPLNANKPSRVVLFIIEQAVLHNMFKNNNACIYIFDENNRLIFSDSKDTNLQKKLQLFGVFKPRMPVNKINSVKIDGINYSVVKMSSDYNYWKYVTVTRTDQFMAPVYLKENLFFVSFFVIVIIGTTIAFALARRNNMPLQKLLENLSGKDLSVITRKYRNDMEYIADVINQIREKNKYLLKKQFLNNLLEGKYGSLAEITAAGSEADVHLERPHFLVCLFFSDAYKQIENDKIPYNNLKDNIIDFLGEMTEQIERVNGFMVEMDDNRSHALILNFDDSVDIKKEILNLSDYIKDIFEADSGFTIGVGQVYSNSAKIKQSYDEAKKAIYYRLVKGNNNVIFYDEIKENQNKKYKYPSNLETALIKAIKHSHQENVAKITRELKEYLTNQQIPLESIQCICYGILNSVIKIVDEMQMDASDCFMDEEDSLLVQNFDTIDSMLDRLAIFCEKICNYTLEQKENDGERLIGVIFEAINGRLYDKTLSLKSLAADCGVSPSYLCRYFKQKTNGSLMQYVDQQRMAKTRELLVTTKFSLNEILDFVGYIDPANFIRKFKKAEGVTPMKYRELHGR
jgi:two-component system response regulator YesN